METDHDQERYQVILEHVRYEGQLLWQIFGAFLVAHTVLMAFLLQAGLGSIQSSTSQPSITVASIVGIILCIPWLASYLRSSDYYTFRMAQAREAEPDGWNLLKGKGEPFSRGEPVKIGGQIYRVNFLGRVLRTQRSIPLLISSFAFVYALLLLYSR